MPKFNVKFDFIPVPEDFIENHMPQAISAYVKVYLLALSYGMKGENVTTAQMAQKLNMLEGDVINAVKYWENEGVLSEEGAAVKTEKPSAPAESAEDEAETDAPRRKTIQQISEEITNNRALADLCTLAQEILGKPLRNKEIETLYWFYDELKLSPEVITMLLEYCVSKNKRSMRYIERVAITWHEKGIVTIDAADKFIASENEKSGYFPSLKKLFGIENRSFTKTEEAYLKAWRDEYGMDENMVGLAYEYCVMSINKMSYPYMDSIIKRWNELGIHTVEAAESDREDFKNKSKHKNLDVYNDKSSDYGEIEKILREKM